MASRLNTCPRWLSPCGTGNENGVQTSDSVNVRPQHPLNIHSLAFQAKIDKSYEDRFSGEFVSKMFKGESLESVHKQYAAQTYDFLPSITVLGKVYREKVPQHILDNAELDQTLILVFENLQRIAVGVEQMRWDEEDRRGEFIKAFDGTWSRVNNLLCEVHNVMIVKNLTVETFIGREIMGDTLRQANDDTARNIRNWIIYREYLNMLEYIEQVFDHLSKKMMNPV